MSLKKLQHRNHKHEQRYARLLKLEPWDWNDNLKASSYSEVLTCIYPKLLKHSRQQQLEFTQLVSRYGRQLDTLDFFSVNQIVDVRQHFWNQPVTLELNRQLGPHVDSLSAYWHSITRKDLAAGVTKATKALKEILKADLAAFKLITGIE